MTKKVFFNLEIKLPTQDDTKKACEIFNKEFTQSTFSATTRMTHPNIICLRSKIGGAELDRVGLFFLRLAEELMLKSRIAFIYITDHATSKDGGIFLFDPQAKAVAFLDVDDFVERGAMNFEPEWDMQIVEGNDHV